MIRIAEVVGTCAEPFVVRDYGCTRILVINRPQARNALTRRMRREFPAYIRAAEEDESVAVIVLTGTGSAFSAGVDLKERRENPTLPPIVPNPADVLNNSRKPVIAAVNGACVTGALEMALSCSFIMASNQASFADTHAMHGIRPRWGQSARLPNAVGLRRARQLQFTGAFIDASTALAWGLVNEVIAHEQLLERCLQVGESIGRAHRGAIAEQLAISRAVETNALAAGINAEHQAHLHADKLGKRAP